MPQPFPTGKELRVFVPNACNTASTFGSALGKSSAVWEVTGCQSGEALLHGLALFIKSVPNERNVAQHCAEVPFHATYDVM